MDGQASPQLKSARGYYLTAYMRSGIIDAPLTSRKTLSKCQKANSDWESISCPQKECLQPLPFLVIPSNHLIHYALSQALYENTGWYHVCEANPDTNVHRHIYIYIYTLLDGLKHSVTTLSPELEGTIEIQCLVIESVDTNTKCYTSKAAQVLKLFLDFGSYNCWDFALCTSSQLHFTVYFVDHRQTTTFIHM